MSILSFFKLNEIAAAARRDPETAKVSLQALGSRVCLSKEVDGIPVQYYCERMEGESSEDFGRRCRREFMEFCQGFESK